jgi:hypothetical protein
MYTSIVRTALTNELPLELSITVIREAKAGREMAGVGCKP